MTDQTLPRIGIIGTGRVARALALGLAPYAEGEPLMWGRSTAAPSLDALVQASDIIAIAVADDALAGVVADLASKGAFGHAPLVFHVSGSHGVGTLAALAEKGALTAAIHPAMTFTGDPAGEVRRMIGARFAVTGSSENASARARHIVQLLGGLPVTVAEEHRALYHAALCHGANHLVTLLAGSAQALRAAGVAEPEALLAPLVRAALENALAKGFAALSGPLMRGDGETIHHHLAAMDKDAPDLSPAYRAMALATLDALERSGRPAAERIRRELDAAG
ncbi:Rossmann-like and DUF2520 domain-containing protein [Novosphingobium rosa]|uniref:Rossmann-like and DUF2520 domain-containing protein n=1 Tax=Novosphingobium rosa TaxID=76978 RepID=UPI000832DDBF|nr:Rossmann-like and DUF2520 domain-containing protein [Novosphingobium rosa]